MEKTQGYLGLSPKWGFNHQSMAMKYPIPIEGQNVSQTGKRWGSRNFEGNTHPNNM